MTIALNYNEDNSRSFTRHTLLTIVLALGLAVILWLITSEHSFFSSEPR